MLGRIAVPDMTPVARAHFALTFTRLAGLAGSPAWAASAAAGAWPARRSPVRSSVAATRRPSVDSRGGAVRLDLPVTVR